MADLIDRQELIDTLKHFAPEHYSPLVNMLIMKAPSIDGAPVVRCKDCKYQSKYWKVDRRMKKGGYWLYWCERNDDPFVAHTVCGEDEEFCSYGERRDSDGKETG